MKSEFLGALIVEQISDSEWRLMKDFLYSSEVLGRTVTVERGFVTDFASVPRLPFVYFLTAGVAVRASVIHDYLYRSGTTSRSDADSVFAEAMKVTGQAAWRRGLMYIGLRLFGWSSYRGKESNPVHSGEGTATAMGIVPPIPAMSSLATIENPNAKHAELINGE